MAIRIHDWVPERQTSEDYSCAAAILASLNREGWRQPATASVVTAASCTERSQSFPVASLMYRYIYVCICIYNHFVCVSPRRSAPAIAGFLYLYIKEPQRKAFVLIPCDLVQQCEWTDNSAPFPSLFFFFFPRYIPRTPPPPPPRSVHACDKSTSSVGRLNKSVINYPVAASVLAHSSKTLVSLKKIFAHPSRLSTVLSHHVHRNWIGKSETERHWLQIRAQN